MAKLHLNITGNDKDFLKAIKESEKAMEEFVDKVQNAGETINMTFDEATTQIKELQTNIKVVRNRLSLLIELQRNAHNVIEETASHINNPQLNNETTDLDTKPVSPITIESLNDAKVKLNRFNNIVNDNKNLLNTLENKYRETLHSISREADKTAPLLDKNPTNKTVRTGVEDIANSISELDVRFAGLKQKTGEITEEDVQQQAEYREELGRVQQKLEGIVSYTQDEEISNPKTQEQYGVVQTILSEVGSELRENSEPINMAAAKDDIEFKNTDGSLKEIAGGLTVVAGAISMFGKENKLLIEIQAKLQAAIAITNGLIKANEGLHLVNSVKLGIVTSVTNAYTAATTRLAVGLGISAVAAKALMATLTLGLSAAIAGIIYLIDQYNEWNEQQKENERLNNIVTDSLKSASLEGEKAAQQEKVNLDILYNASQNERKSKEERLKAINELQKQYPAYFANFSQEEILAGKATTAYNKLSKTIIAAAKSRAYADEIAKNSLKIKELEAKIAEEKIKREPAQRIVNSVDNALSVTALGGEYVGKTKFDKIIDETTANIKNYQDQKTALEKVNTAFEKEIDVTVLLFNGKNDEIIKGSKEGWQEIQQAQQAIMDANMPDSDNFKNAKKLWDEATREADFLALPEKERESILNNQILALKDQKAEIEAIISSSQNLGTPFEKFDIILQLNLKKLKSISNGISDLDSKLPSNQTGQIKNKPYWEKEKEKAQKALNSIDSKYLKVLLKGEQAAKKAGIGQDIIDSYKENYNIINEAEKNLNPYNFSPKTDKSPTDNTQGIIDQEKKIKELLNKQKLERSRKDEDLENKLVQSRIDSLADGAEKVRYQRELNNYLEIQSIEREKEDYIRTIIQAEKEKFDADEKLKATKDRSYRIVDFDSSSIKVDTSSFDKVINNTRNNQITKELDAEKKAWSEYLKEYGNYQEKRLAITDIYNDKIAKAITKGEKATLEKQRDKELATLFTTLPDYNKLFTSVYSLTKGKAIEIGNLIKKNLREQFDKGVLSVNDYHKAIKEVNEELEKSAKGISYFASIQDGGVSGLFSAISTKADSDYKSALIDLDKYKSVYENFRSIGDIESASIAKNNMNIAEGTMKSAEGIQKFAGVAQGTFAIVDRIITAIDQSIKATQRIVDVFASLAEQRGIDTGKGLWREIRDTMSIISQVNEKGKQSWDSLKNGDIVGSLASTVEMIAIGFKSVNGEHKQALKLLELQRLNLEHIYALSQLQKSLDYEMGDTVFGTDGWGKASNAANVYKESVERLNQSLEQLEDVDVVTGSKKSGWGPWRKRKDVWSDLLTTYPKLIDENGKFDKELAKTILTNQTLSEDGQRHVQQAIDNAEMVEAAYAEMKDYLTSIFGDLGHTITDVFVDSFKNGTDAMEAMLDSAGTMLEKLVKDIIYSITIAPIIKKASDEMMKIEQDNTLSDEQKLVAMINVVGDLIDDAIAQQDNANKMLEYAQEKAKDKGINIFDNKDTRSASEKGFATASQDSINDLTGIMTNIQGHTYQINGNVAGLYELSKTFAATYSETLGTCSFILQHTKNIDKNTQELYVMRSDIATMKDGINSLVTHGIDLKK